MKIAYVASRYPAVSHTFIAREVKAIRQQGIDVQTFTVRRCDPEDLLTEADRQEHRQTIALLPTTIFRVLWAHFSMLLRHRRRYVAALWAALRRRPPGLRPAIWQLFYFGEAGLLAAHLHEAGIGHVHAHFANVASAVAMLASKMSGGAWSLTLHGLSDFRNPDGTALSEKICSAAFVVCVSDFGRAQAMLHSPPELWPKIHVVRCGLDLERFSPTSRGMRTKPGSPLRVLNVARLGPEKGHTILLEALQALKHAGVEVRCTVIGSGPERRRLERVARELSIVERIRFVGAVGQDEIRNYYEQADVLVLPSFAEGLPVVLMEAMATGLPVVASQIMGIPELVDHGANGLLVPPGRVRPLVEALATLTNDPSLRARMGAEGRKTVCREHDIRRSAEQLAHLFDSIHPGPPVPDPILSSCATVGAAGS